MDASQKGEPPDVWRENYTVRLYEADALGRAGVTELCNYFQNSASSHYVAVDKIAGPLLPPDSAWVMTRMEVEFKDFPQWQDEVTLETWSRGINSLIAYRDFFISQPTGRILAQGTSSWVVVNLSTRKIESLTFLAPKWPSITGKRALAGDAVKIRPFEQPTFEQTFQVRYSDLDVNRHANNVKYIQWAVDSLSPGILAERRIARLEINYLEETKVADCIEMGLQRLSENPLRVGVAIRSKSRGKDACRVIISFA